MGPSVQDKQKEIALFDRHAEADAYDVFTPESNQRLIASFTAQRSARWRTRRRSRMWIRLFTAELKRAGYSVVGLDISLKLISVGQSKYPGLELIEGDAEKLPFESGTMHGVLLSGLVHLSARP
jgi:hypothetical protein